ncbi:hypothetical protein C8T65DRAFT_546443, partial [Cerioporus squamosus]
THFNCDRVQFSSVVDRHDRSQIEEVWQPASVLVSEMNENATWLMVSLKTEGDPVVVWRAIQEGWSVACDERSMTMLMHKKTADDFSDMVQKLRFVARKDYWSFLAHFASSRVHAYVGSW